MLSSVIKEYGVGRLSAKVRTFKVCIYFIQIGISTPYMSISNAFHIYIMGTRVSIIKSFACIFPE